MKNRWVDAFLWAMGGMVLLIGGLSLRWRMDFDTPLLLYLGRLISWGEVPYRDFFDVNLPGTYLINYLVVRFLGTGDLAVRIADLGILTAVCGITAAALCRLEKRVAAAAGIVFALLYLSYGTLFTLQRDFLLLLPLATAIYCLLVPEKWFRPGWGLGVGLCFGFIAVIKPQACLALPVFGLAGVLSPEPEVEGYRSRKNVGVWVSAVVIGFMLPLMVSWVYLRASGGLQPFLDIVNGYWPLFADLSGDQRVLAGLESRLMYRVHRFEEELGGLLLLLPGLYGAWIGWEVGRERPRVRRAVILFLGLAAANALSVFLVGRFWAYHWIPCWFSLSVLSAFSLLPHALRGRSMLIFFIFAVQLMLPFLPRVYGDLRFGHVIAPKNGRVDEIAAFLKERLVPGDTVQPLDWTEGSLNAMLAVDARLATSFAYTYQFQHHVSTPYVRALRGRFLEELNAAQPRFVIETHSIWWILRGPDTSPEFPRLRNLLEERYQPVLQGDGFTIHALREGAASDWLDH